jgi:hypothetical protein
MQNHNNVKKSLGNSIKQEYHIYTRPADIRKREFTVDECDAMFYNFHDTHSWSYINPNGHIILGGGESEGGNFYITEKDLYQLVFEYIKFKFKPILDARKNTINHILK